MKKENILITTSDNFASNKIKAQYGIVDSQIVVGANLFRDVFSSFRDIFGGETKGYKKDINKMKKAALDSIKEQASDYGANASKLLITVPMLLFPYALSLTKYQVVVSQCLCLMHMVLQLNYLKKH